MLYRTYQLQDDLVAPWRAFARWAKMANWPKPFGESRALRRVNAALELIARFELTHTRPAFGIDSVRVGKQKLRVVEETHLTLPFGSLVRFAKATGPEQPKVLIVAPLSGHFATLLRGTIETMLRDYDVYITDWANARDVSADAGPFGVDEYIDYLIRFLEEIGPGGNILAVCQPCVQALAAVAIMSEDRHPATPRSMTLMAGPIDTRESPTRVNELATDRPLTWFENTLIARVPGRFPGAGRAVYPGFVQLNAFMTMNMDRHQAAHRKMYEHLARGEEAEAEKIKTFYDEYFAVLDLTKEFYLETIERIFQQAQLANGTFMYRGRKVNPGAIQRTALLTVEGGRDDICSLGQTAAAHDLCNALRPHLKRHHLQANVGHYGVFSGKRWDKEIYPVVSNTILAMA